MHELTRYKWGLFRHFCESFPNAYYDVPGLIKDANGAWIKAADVEGVVSDARCLSKFVHDLGYQTETQELDLTTAEFTEMWKVATRLLARLEGK